MVVFSTALPHSIHPLANVCRNGGSTFFSLYNLVIALLPNPRVISQSFAFCFKCQNKQLLSNFTQKQLILFSNWIFCLHSSQHCMFFAVDVVDPRKTRNQTKYNRIEWEKSRTRKSYSVYLLKDFVTSCNVFGPYSYSMCIVIKTLLFICLPRFFLTQKSQTFMYIVWNINQVCTLHVHVIRNVVQCSSQHAHFVHSHVCTLIFRY